jgi:DNA-binding GntR family transcriptional regulator
VTSNLIQHNTLSEVVYAAIKERILTGQFKQGEKILELAVSQEFGVSSTPVREALRLLHGDGLVRFEGRRGARVIEPSVDEVRHAYQAREVIECAALREASENFSKSDIDEFLRLATATTRGDMDSLEFLKADRAFHQFFIRKSQSTWYLKFHTEIAQVLVVVRIPRIARWKIESAGREHVEIAQAVKDNDVDKAVSILRKQIRTSCRWATSGSNGET